jgi:hypothetical protein
MERVRTQVVFKCLGVLIPQQKLEILQDTLWMQLG